MNIHSTIRTQLRHSLLGIAALALLGGTGCDPEGNDDLDRSASELEDAAHEPLRAVPTGPQNVTAAADAPVTAFTYVHTYEGGHQLAHLADGDIIMLKNFEQGYLGCNDDDDTIASDSPYNTDDYVWQVHRTDLDGDGTDEVQLERAGGTGLYLKMDSGGDVFCGTITGIGDAAAWNIGPQYAGAGNLYKRVASNLVNYKQAQCLKVDSGGQGTGGNCNSAQGAVFFTEVVGAV